MITYTSMSFGIALSALLVCLTDLLFTILDGHTGKPRNRVYIVIMLLLAVNAACEMVNVQVGMDDINNDRIFFISRLSKYLYFLCHAMIAPMLFYYVSFLVGSSVGMVFHRKTQKSDPRFILSFLPVIFISLTELAVILNPLTQWCWYFTENREFHRSWGEYIFIYGMSAIWVIAAFVMVMRSWNILSKGRKLSIAICFLLACAGIMTQLISKEYRVEVLMEAIGFTGVLLFVENEDDRRNVELNAYNSAAFSLDMAASIKSRVPVKVLIIRSIGFDTTANSVVSVKMDRDAVSLAVSEYLGTVIKRYYIYAIGNGRFALTLFDYTDEEASALAQTIQMRFQKPWAIDGLNLILACKILLVRVPEVAKTVDELIYITECPIPETMTERIINDTSLDWIIRRATVEKAVTHGLEEHAFEVYYQPTYNMDRTLHGAEALLRMHDREMGMIYPDEFIPIAEQLGIIDHLDEFVLREVCEFVRSGIPEKNGMDCINVNLSVLECMKEGFAEYISGIVNDAGISPRMINFEITESVAAKDYDHLAGVISQLRKQGFQFSIDDYGTGYSNMTSLFSLGVDIIKLDKSLLWNAETSELGMTLLRVSMELVHKMQKRALMEGVETEEHLRILKKLGCEYLQGYYFSKPLPKADFIALIEAPVKE